MTVGEKIIYYIAKRRKLVIQQDFVDADAKQKKLFTRLLSLFEGSVFAQEYRLNRDTPYYEFQKNVPVFAYEDFYPYIEKMLNQEAGIVRKSTVTMFAKSSGTTNARSKYIPLTQSNLRNNHYQAGRDMITWAVAIHHNASFVTGKMIGTTGSFSYDSSYPHAQIGDVSAHLFHSLPWYAKHTRVTTRDIFLQDSWKEKVVNIAKDSITKNVRVVLGTPTWILHIFNEVLTQSGKKHIMEVWPKFSMFFHGAVNFEPYRKIFEEKVGKRVDYMNIYNASEGFIGFQYTQDDSNVFVLLTNHDIFYECILLSDFKSARYNAIPLCEVELHKEYILLLTTSGGLVRYSIGDTVRFSSKNPYLFELTGRTKQFLNTFGEEVSVENIDKALAEALLKTGGRVAHFTVAPIILEKGYGYHSWCIEWEGAPPNKELFEDTLDVSLRLINSDYDAKRTGDMVMKKLFIQEVPQGTFLKWLSKKGKLGGQHKVPLITSNVDMINELIAIQ